jgi:hypothetical protein
MDPSLTRDLPGLHCGTTLHHLFNAPAANLRVRYLFEALAHASRDGRCAKLLRAQLSFSLEDSCRALRGFCAIIIPWAFAIKIELHIASWTARCRLTFGSVFPASPA